MEWLNYHHLLYFWMVAKEGSISQAAKVLRLAQPTISGQIRELERALEQKLFTRVGRNLQLTEVGHVVYRYADEIFTLGQELTATLKGRPTGRPVRLRVGIADVLPKLLSHRLLAPALALEDPPLQLICREDKTDRLLAELSVQRLDLVLADAPIGPNVRVRAYNHLLGSCGTSFFGTPELVEELSGDFPACLNDAPMLLPTDNSPLARGLDRWFEHLEVRPTVVAEFDDSALMKVFGKEGAGLFPGPSVVAQDIERGYEVRTLGTTEDVQIQIYAITVERRVKHPALAAMLESAKSGLFA